MSDDAVSTGSIPSDASLTSSSPPPELAKRPGIWPTFAVCVVNDYKILQCLLAPGATSVTSETAEILRNAQAPLVDNQPTLRCLLHSPNIVREDLPDDFVWEADLLVDGQPFYIGTLSKRCEAVDVRLKIAAPARNVALRLQRFRPAEVRSDESTELAAEAAGVVTDAEINPRSGSMAISQVAEETKSRNPELFRKVIDTEYAGSFRSFLAAHPDRFSLFTNRAKNNKGGGGSGGANNKKGQDSGSDDKAATNVAQSASSTSSGTSTSPPPQPQQPVQEAQAAHATDATATATPPSAPSNTAAAPASSSSSPDDQERVAAKKETRESYPPMLPPGHPHEGAMIDLLRGELQRSDASLHFLARTLAANATFRVSMSAAFSALMHWLQRHRDTFTWSTDPRTVCTIGLTATATAEVAAAKSKPTTDDGAVAAKSPQLHHHHHHAHEGAAAAAARSPKPQRQRLPPLQIPAPTSSAAQQPGATNDDDDETRKEGEFHLPPGLKEDIDQ